MRSASGEPIALSAEHNIGFGDLFDALTPYFPEIIPEEDADEEANIYADEAGLDALEGRDDFDFVEALPPEDEEKPIKLAIVGRPNAGKSTLLNALVGYERSMTGPEAGITRDAIAVQWAWKDRAIRLVDTAGMRKKGKIYNVIEKMAVDDTLRAIRLAQVVVLVLDAATMLEKQDLLIAEHVLNEGRALIICVNKWDTVDDRAMALKKLEDRMQASLSQVPGVPVIALSALRGSNLPKLMNAVLEIYGIWNSRAKTGRLNRWLASMESQHPAPMVHGRPNRLRYITQIKTRPPTFAIWVSKPTELPETYKRYLIGGLREICDIHGVPVRLLVRASKNPYVD